MNYIFTLVHRGEEIICIPSMEEAVVIIFIMSFYHQVVVQLILGQNQMIYIRELLLQGEEEVPSTILIIIQEMVAMQAD